MDHGQRAEPFRRASAHEATACRTTGPQWIACLYVCTEYMPFEFGLLMKMEASSKHHHTSSSEPGKKQYWDSSSTWRFISYEV